MYRLQSQVALGLSIGLVTTVMLAGCQRHQSHTAPKRHVTTPNGIAAADYVPNLVPAYLIAPAEKTHIVSASLASPMICEPVVGAGLPLKEAQFGSGCSRWLQFTVGGLPQVGATPTWSSLSRACAETSRPDLRLGPKDIPGFTRATGVNIIALSSITGTPADLHLTYRLFDTQTRRPFGAPLELAGTKDKILAQLPEIAVRLADLLGVHRAILPTSVQVGSADLTLMGGIPWVPDTTLDEKTRQRLLKLRNSTGLAARLLIWAGSDRGRVTASLKSHPIPAASHNVLLIEGYYDRYVQIPINPAVFNRLLAQHPTNLALNTTAAYRDDSLNDFGRAEQLASRVTEIAPYQPNSWTVLCDINADDAENIRKGKFADEMSFAMSHKVNTLYQSQLQAGEHAVQLDPNFGPGWYEIQEAATFAGQDALAWKAFAKASKTDENTWRPYNWALQMTQSKWFGDRTDLIQMASRVAKHFHYDRYALRAVTQLHDDGYPGASQRLLNTIVQKNLSLLAANPHAAEALYTLGNAMRAESKFAVATIYLARLTRLRPYYGRAYAELGGSYSAVNLFQPAYNALKKANKLSPLNAQAFERMAEVCFNLRHFHQAAAAAKHALSIEPNFVFAIFYRGNSLEMLNQHKQALPYLLLATQLYPRTFQAQVPYSFWRVLGNCQLALHHYRQAIKTYTTCIAEQPSCFPALNNMAVCYEDLHQYGNAITTCNRALQLVPRSPMAWMNLAFALYQTHDVAGARKAWQNTVSFAGNNVLGVEARKNLKLTSKASHTTKPH